MNPEQAAAFINAQTAMLLLELEAHKAYDRCHPEAPYQPEVYQALYDRYEFTLGHNAVLNIYQDAARNA